jgi:ABC-2 type transport system ATP-binding protein
MHKADPVLQGAIKDIKKKFPQERVVVAADGDIQGLEAIAGVSEVFRHEHGGYELKVSTPAAGQLILQHALSQGPVIRFEIMEPTLNEIFIKTVGVNHE